MKLELYKCPFLRNGKEITPTGYHMLPHKTHGDRNGLHFSEFLTKGFYRLSPQTIQAVVNDNDYLLYPENQVTTEEKSNQQFHSAMVPSNYNSNLLIRYAH